MIEKSYVGSCPPTEKSHFWSFGAFQVCLVFGIAALLLIKPPPIWTQQEPALSSSPTVTRDATEIAAARAAEPDALPERETGPGSTGTGKSRDFVTYENRDMFGGDYAKIANSSNAECETLCRSDNRCRAYTHNKWEQVCFLKSSIGAVRIEPQGTTGIAASEDVRQDRRPPTIQKSRSRRLSGDSYMVLATKSYDNCAAECLADTECLGFNFTRTERTCSLMSSLYKPTPAHATDAGIKVQRSASAHRRPQSGTPVRPSRMPSEVTPIFEAVLRELGRY
jgi:hypothetical protein